MWFSPSIRRVKSLKSTLYSLPKTILISPYTPLHDVNVTSIYSNTRTHILIFLYKTNLPFDLWLERGRNRSSFLPFPSTQYVITICFMNRSLLFSNDDWIVSILLFHNYYLLIWLSIIVRKGLILIFKRLASEWSEKISINPFLKVI